MFCKNWSSVVLVGKERTILSLVASVLASPVAIPVWPVAVVGSVPPTVSVVSIPRVSGGISRRIGGGLGLGLGISRPLAVVVSVSVGSVVSPGSVAVAVVSVPGVSRRVGSRVGVGSGLGISRPLAVVAVVSVGSVVAAVVAAVAAPAVVAIPRVSRRVCRRIRIGSGLGLGGAESHGKERRNLENRVDVVYLFSICLT